MLFSSTTFLFGFLPAVLLMYFLMPVLFRKHARTAQNAVLFLFSLVFYAWGEPIYIFLMCLSITVAYITGILADKTRLPENKKDSKGPFAAMMTAVVWNLGLLLFFKYTDFFINTINSAAGTQLKPTGLALPIGISFYSFQTLSYVIDVYKGNVKCQKNILHLGTYVALFPQLIAGPIVRYIDVAEQLVHRDESIEKFAEGVKRFCIGLGKKVIIANAVGELFDSISNSPQSELSIAASWIGIIAYTFQIYFDFSGYSDMAIGLGKMFGFDFLENFNYPYISDSITEFWRRWHISLSSWFRDYVYIPLGGNRKGKARQCVNIMVVWFLTGFWHGANWNFMMWGVYFGVILLLEKNFLLKLLKKSPKIIQHIYALLLIVIGWGIFAYEDTSALLQNLKNMFGFGGLPLWNGQTAFWLTQNIVLFMLAIVCSTPLIKKAGGFMAKHKPSMYETVIVPAECTLLFIVSVAYLAGNSFNPFLYFRF
ncbi:MBOAT family O-acyltransferase [Ruminococcus albus]|uniref:Alginate O-acetyltransferase complex protein AlgI n=1 Tax=Ruminococcus albus TaxID=1264 RepID=A0A1I1HKV6_RUMAL|nr:MBOAT family O-acyltransferase [Ruminococcus albus]SFC24192.1 alginate O-acetyltransferase complex protein AlgI [Ruminococcus albus]